MNVRLTRSYRPGRSVLYSGVTRITSDWRFMAGSGANLWLRLDDSRSEAGEARCEPSYIGIGGRHGAIELVLDEDGGVCD